ncbi:peptidoglycan-binding domain-containing protein [Actinomadura flavalba]|uniref:peptidoglycan-binding domain-containing protein n=1 Tax=Actinomadura flavalba TaxID=1120938 RepID=UPI000366246D|nr:peptidoglycan-binding domain-containing protein [Actinomadura flavalba]
MRFERLVRTAGLECRAEPKTRLPVPVAVGDDQGDPVVTALPIKQGRRVGEGQVVMEVSGRPVILLVGRLPAYRDILPNASGPDVEQLQAALSRLGILGGGAARGRFDAVTRMAVYRLYRQRGYPPPGLEPKDEKAEKNAAVKVTLPRRELLMVPTLPASLGTVKARVGASVRTGDVVLTSGRPVLRCIVEDASAAFGLRKGAKATVSTPGGGSLTARVQRISTSAAESSPREGAPRSQDGDGEEERTEVTLEAARTLRIGKGYQARVEIEKAGFVAPVVPSSALWSQSGGRTIVKVLRAGHRVEVAVRPGFEVDGQVTVTATGGTLRQGDEVIVAADAGQGGQP